MHPVTIIISKIVMRESLIPSLSVVDTLGIMPIVSYTKNGTYKVVMATLMVRKDPEERSACRSWLGHDDVWGWPEEGPRSMY